MVRQEEVDVNQSQTVELGEGDNNGDNTAEQIPLPALPAHQEAGGADGGAGCRYLGRERKKPSRVTSRNFGMGGNKGPMGGIGA